MILQTNKAFFSNLLMHIGSLRVKKRLLKVGCIVSLFGITASIVHGTDLRIRAQDDETEGGLKLNLSIPQILEDGPKGAGIEVIAEGNERAIKDQGGNFLNYVNVDIKGNKASRVNVTALKSFTGNWPATEADVRIIAPDQKRTQTSLPISQNYRGHSFAEIQNLKYYIPNNINNSKEIRYPFALELRDSIAVEKMPFFDSVSTFGTIWNVFDMYGKDINGRLNITSSKLRAAQSRWLHRTNIRIFPHMTAKQFQKFYPKENYKKHEKNAFYDFRKGDKDGEHVLCFFPIIIGGSQYTSQSFDVVSHEGGHCSLNILRPDLWNSASTDVVAFHETFGDMTAFFAVLSFPELRQRVLEKTRGNLHVSSFLSVIGEKISDRDASECTKLSLIPSCEEHELSERLTRALYGTFADFFNITRADNKTNMSTLFEQTATDFRVNFLNATLTSPLTSFVAFGRQLRLEGTPLFQQLVHINFLRHGIDLTDHKLSAQICLLSDEDEEEGQSKVVGCSTGKIGASSSVFYERDTNANYETKMRFLTLNDTIGF